jgi:hypothetical protein
VLAPSQHRAVQGNIVDPPYEEYEALNLEKAAAALSATPAYASDRVAIGHALAALQAAATKHHVAAAIDSFTGRVAPEAELNYDAALDSEARAVAILVTLGAGTCR